jgi:beta-glucosidase-like glycosyl hydrolase
MQYFRNWAVTASSILVLTVRARADLCTSSSSQHLFVQSCTCADTFAAWDQASQKAHEFVSNLTLSETIGIVSGGYSQPSLPCVGAIGPVPRLQFDGICFSDGPAGYSRSDGVSVFASGITAAASWDRNLMYERAVAIGEEFRAKGAHVHLGYVH